MSKSYIEYIDAITKLRSKMIEKRKLCEPKIKQEAKYTYLY
jgi:hypothetical protein